MSSVHYSSKTFVQAAEIAEQIESLEKQLAALLQGGNSVGGNSVAGNSVAGNSVAVKPSAPKVAPKRRVSAPKKAETSAPKASEEGRGTLRPAVVAILKKSKNPLKTADIYDALVAQGYTFTFKEAKKVLGIRLYKMLGVQPLGGGLFKAK
jgi:hypothetical protein